MKCVERMGEEMEAEEEEEVGGEEARE